MCGISRLLVYSVILDEKPLIYIWRPFYRVVYAPLIRPFFVAGGPSLGRGTQKELAEVSEKLTELLKRMDQSDAETARRWAAMEGLLLAMLSEADRRSGSPST